MTFIITSIVAPIHSKKQSKGHFFTTPEFCEWLVVTAAAAAFGHCRALIVHYDAIVLISVSTDNHSQRRDQLHCVTVTSEASCANKTLFNISVPTGRFLHRKAWRYHPECLGITVSCVQCQMLITSWRDPYLHNTTAVFI